jgi:glycosyltransferase involved in cell wall biosynthesis
MIICCAFLSANMKRILILYRELAGYFIDCVEYLCEHHDVRADIVAYPVNAEAPFQFKHSDRIRIFSRHDFKAEDLQRLTSSGEYQLIFCGGWFDPEYLGAVQQRKCPALLGFDNAWEGSVKQHLAALYARFKIKPLFDFAFVPGSRQGQFARRMGFSARQIITGAYSCNVHSFDDILHARMRREEPQEKKLIFVGRYTHSKFIPELFQSWQSLHDEGLLNGWKLHAVGTGDLFDTRTIHDTIVHHGFMQPQELLRFMNDGDAFILPSRFEPWGVVVHEFASAGYAMILSTAVNSGEAFLSPNINGYLFPAGNAQAMRDAIFRLIQTSHLQRLEMGSQSRRMAESITPSTWASSLFSCMA